MRVYRIYMPVCLSNVQFLPTITLAKLTFPFAFNKLIDWLTLARLVLKQVQLWRLPGLWCNGILLNITVQTRTHYERLQFVENKAAGMWTVVSEAVDEIQLTLSDWRVLKRCHTHKCGVLTRTKATNWSNAASWCCIDVETVCWKITLRKQQVCIGPRASDRNIRRWPRAALWHVTVYTP